MQTIETQIDIDASVEEVWSVFSDFARWPEWNSFVRKIEGTVAEGERIVVKLYPPGSRPATFKPRVVALQPNDRFHWLGRLLIPGLFDGEHQFRVESLGEGRTRFIQREEFRGLLTGLMMRLVREATTQGFEDSNRELKERVEQSGG